MAFMKPVAEKLTMYIVETQKGRELVPEGVCGKIPIGDSTDWRTALAPYVNASMATDPFASYERVRGWWGRLSADGYLDCTQWMGPYATEAEALAAVEETYDVDENGDEPTNSE